jgi:SAM-dependent methyltransferase
MSQNIYDRPDFFEGYSRLGRSVSGLDGAAEWRALRALLPDMNGLRVLDLGCGFGWFCRWARERGAAQVVGLDLSDKMLAQARANTSDMSITYERADLEQLDLPEACFDLVCSSLAVHYISGAGRLFETIYRALIPRGSFIFSTEHPILHGASESELVDGRGGSKDLAAKQLLYGRPANDRLDCRRRRKTSPYTRDDPQSARAIWV